MSSAVPEGWKVTKIFDVRDAEDNYSFTGGPFGSNLKSEDYTEKGIRIIQLQNIGDGQFLNDYKIFTSKEKADELLSCNIYPSNIILSKMGDPVARATLMPDFEKRYLMASDGIRLSVDEENYDSKFILDSINHHDFRIQAEVNSTGSTRKRIGLKELRNLTISCPPLPEQKKIASILTSVDEVIENTQKQIDKLQDLKKATMNELLTKGIGHTEFKDSELGRIPKSWDVIKLSGLCSLHYGKSPKEIEDDDGMYPIYGTGGIVGKTNSALHAGKSIVIGRKGSVDNVSFVDSPFWAIDTTYYVEGKNVEMKWLFYRLQYEGLKKYNEASGVPSLSRDTLYNISIQSPPASEQTQICVILDTVESHISSLDIKLHQTQSLKKSLMQDLLTGKVRVTVN